MLQCGISAVKGAPMNELVSMIGLPPALFAVACLATFVAGFVKGAVGFAMPMIMISSLGSFLPVETALAALILPTVFANVRQALRQGIGPAWRSMLMFKRFLLIGLVFLVASAQLVAVLPSGILFLLIGFPVSFFALAQLAGWRLRLGKSRAKVEFALASVAGFCGGMSGVWGPPTVAYLTAIDAPKQESMRVQGVVYGLGSIALLAAHVQSGVLRSETLPLGVAMLFPAIAGIIVGAGIHNRMNQERFRFLTLIVLVIAGLNLIRRGIL
jgi:uncharacterized membrane protein YfcA